MSECKNSKSNSNLCVLRHEHSRVCLAGQRQLTSPSSIYSSLLQFISLSLLGAWAPNLKEHSSVLNSKLYFFTKWVSIIKGELCIFIYFFLQTKTEFLKRYCKSQHEFQIHFKSCFLLYLKTLQLNRLLFWVTVGLDQKENIACSRSQDYMTKLLL